MTNKPSNTKFFSQIESARNNLVRTINQTMVTTYFEIGRKVAEEEQNGKDRANYGEKVIQELSKVLTTEFGKGFSTTNPKQMRQFCLAYSISQALSDDFKNLPQTSTVNSEKEIQQTASVEFNLSCSDVSFP